MYDIKKVIKNIKNKKLKKKIKKKVFNLVKEKILKKFHVLCGAVCSLHVCIKKISLYTVVFFIQNNNSICKIIKHIFKLCVQHIEEDVCV